MTIDSATAVELVDMVAGFLILAVAIYAQRKFRFPIFKLGWDIIAASGAIRVAGSISPTQSSINSPISVR